jgi:hypothetical protein
MRVVLDKAHVANVCVCVRACAVDRWNGEPLTVAHYGQIYYPDASDLSVSIDMRAEVCCAVCCCVHGV